MAVFLNLRNNIFFWGGGVSMYTCFKLFFQTFYLRYIYHLSFCYIFQYFVVLLVTFLVQAVAGIMGFVFYGQVRHYSLFCSLMIFLKILSNCIEEISF